MDDGLTPVVFMHGIQAKVEYSKKLIWRDAGAKYKHDAEYAQWVRYGAFVHHYFTFRHHVLCFMASVQLSAELFRIHTVK